MFSILIHWHQQQIASINEGKNATADTMHNLQVVSGGDMDYSDHGNENENEQLFETEWVWYLPTNESSVCK